MQVLWTIAPMLGVCCLLCPAERLRLAQQDVRVQSRIQDREHSGQENLASLGRRLSGETCVRALTFKPRWADIKSSIIQDGVGVRYLMPWLRYLSWMIHRCISIDLLFCQGLTLKQLYWASLFFPLPSLEWLCCVCVGSVYVGCGTLLVSAHMTRSRDERLSSWHPGLIPGHNHDWPPSEQTWDSGDNASEYRVYRVYYYARLFMHAVCTFNAPMPVKVNNNDSTGLQPPACQGPLPESESVYYPQKIKLQEEI